MGQVKITQKICLNTVFAIASARYDEGRSITVFDVILQNNESSLQDFKPLLSSGFRSLMESDSLQDKVNQLFDESMTFVFSRALRSLETELSQQRRHTSGTYQLDLSSRYIHGNAC